VGTSTPVRSTDPDAAWFRGTCAAHQGCISTGCIEADGTFVDIEADDSVQAELDAAYHANYGGRYPGLTARITSPARACRHAENHSCTI
jgi:Uncharacterized protein conserved in bacteria (DUF2255)